MASKNWTTAHTLEKEALSVPTNSANFFQLVENLAHYHGSDLAHLEKIHINASLFRFTVNPSVAFPSADINKIESFSEKGKIKQYLIETNFLGLNGSSSPLPGMYLEEIAHEYSQGIGIKHHFFDFFNHRLIVLFIQSWRKYRYYINFKYGVDDEFSQRLFAFIGVGEAYSLSQQAAHEANTLPNDLEGLDWHKLLYFMGILVSRVRSPAMVAEIIMHYFNLKSVKIKEWQKQKISISAEQTNQLGVANISLSDDFILGDNTISYAKKFVVVLDSLDLSEFYDFLPQGKKNLILRKLIMFLMKDLLPYDIHLGIKLDTVPDFILGDDKHSLLGWTTFMNSDSEEIFVSPVEIVGQM